jgi:hypothetical protein
MEPAPGRPPASHSTIREGIRLGCLVAASIWLWIAAVDAVVGEPFHTFNVLGGMAVFTVTHFALNIALASVVVAGMQGAIREPSFIGAVIMLFLILELALAMATVFLSHAGLGDLAWLRIFGGSIVGAAVAIVSLIRRQSLRTVLRQVRMDEKNV